MSTGPMFWRLFIVDFGISISNRKGLIISSESTMISAGQAASHWPSLTYGVGNMLGFVLQTKCPSLITVNQSLDFAIFLNPPLNGLVILGLHVILRHVLNSLRLGWACWPPATDCSAAFSILCWPDKDLISVNSNIQELGKLLASYQGPVSQIRRPQAAKTSEMLPKNR